MNTFFCLCILLNLLAQIYSGYSNGKFRSTGSEVVTEAINNCYFHFCNSTDGYPHEIIRTVLKKNHNFVHMFGDVLEKHRNTRSANANVTDVGCNCNTLEVSEYFPRRAMDVNNNWKVVVNLENYEQKVSIGICQNKSSTVCRQKFEFKKLVVLNENEELKYEALSIPSGCTCS